MNWKPAAHVEGRQHKYQREDGWTIYLEDETLLMWRISAPGSDHTWAHPLGFSPDQIGSVLRWADEVIAKSQEKSWGDLVDYIDNHTACAESVWSNLKPPPNGLYPFIQADSPNKGQFLNRIRQASQNHPPLNPLDGEEHSL